MFDWLFIRHKEKRKKEREKREKEHEEERLKAMEKAKKRHEEDLKKIEKWEGEMISKPCTIRGDENCFKNCVHFQKGIAEKPNVIYSQFQRPYMWIVWMSKPIKPCCKLWGNQKEN